MVVQIFLNLLKFFLKPEIISLGIVWVIFKCSIWYARKSLLLVIEEELGLAGQWLHNAYNKNSSNKKWYNPLFMVVNLRRFRAISAFFSSPYVLLFGKDFLKNLTSLNQGIGRLDQHLDRYMSFITSHWKDSYYAHKLIDKDLADKKVTVDDIRCKIQEWEKDKSQETVEKARYLKFIYLLNKQLHIDGIGKKESDYTGGEDIYGKPRKFYNAHESWVLAVSSFKEEKEKKYLRFSEENWQGVFSDSLLFLLLLLSYLFSIL